MRLMESGTGRCRYGKRICAVVLCHLPARISTPIQGVFDVAVAWFVLRRGRVIWSVSVAIRGRVIERA